MKNYLARTGNRGDLGFGFWNDPFEDFFKPFFYGERRESMKTDVKQTEKGYEVSIDLPGFDKKDISVSLEGGYLTVKAARENKEESGNYLRRERSYSCSRSFYVGDNVTEKDIKAKYNNGTLSLDIPNAKEKEIPSGNIQID